MKKHLTNALSCFLIFSLAAALHGCDVSGIIEDDIIEEIDEKQNELDREDEENTEAKVQSFTAKIDGRNFSTGSTPSNEGNGIALELDNPPGQNVFILKIAAVDIRLGDKTGDIIRMDMYGQDFSSLAKGTTFKPLENIPIEDFSIIDDYYVSGMVSGSLNGSIIFGTTLGLETIEVVITEIDHKTKRISGKFDFTVYDSDKDKYIEVTEGEFKNVRWGEE